MFPFTIGANDTITVHMGSKTRSVRSDHPNYDKVLEALKDEDWESVEVLIDTALAVEEASYGSFRVIDGQVLCKDFSGNEFEVPSGLNEEILKYLKLGLNYERLVLFARRLVMNPSYRAVNQLFTWLHEAGLTITEDGKFIAYRGVMRVNDANRGSLPEQVRGAEYVDWHSKSFDNSLGKVVSMPRNQVDENPMQSCSHGLHAATYEYAHRFYNSGSNGEVLFVEICPSHVVAVPNGEPDKMRVCEYTVKGLSEAPIDEPHYNEHSDTDIDEVYSDTLPSPSWENDDWYDDDYDDEDDEDDDYESDYRP